MFTQKQKIAAVGAIVILTTLTTCSSSPAGAAQLNTETDISSIASFNEKISEITERTKILEEQKAEQQRLTRNTNNINETIDDLKTHVGKTWYVFSGSTPSGWDCSGLVKWTYEQLGVELEHRASIQKDSGKLVKEPKVGDIVAFGWKGYRSAGHVGIYIGHGKMIHAPRPGMVTQIEDVSQFGSNYTKITYTRIIDSL